jgi:hypothetical protein
MSLVEVGRHSGKNESSIHSTALSSIHSEHAWVFLHGNLLRTIDSQIPRVYCIYFCFAFQWDVCVYKLLPVANEILIDSVLFFTLLCIICNKKY